VALVRARHSRQLYRRSWFAVENCSLAGKTMVVIPCTPDAIPRISRDYSKRATKTELTEPFDLSSSLRPVA
jgi:hypothetical protein